MLGITKSKQEPRLEIEPTEREIPKHLLPRAGVLYQSGIGGTGEAYAPARYRPRETTISELEDALAAATAAPPPPLSEEARRMVDDQRIKRAEIVRDTQRATAVARLAEFDAWVITRLREMDEEVKEFNRFAEARRADLVAFSDRIYAWGDDHVANVRAEQEEQARLHARDVDIVTSTQALLEKHGVPLPPPKPALPAVTEQGGEEHGVEAESKE